jgi:hypothetical protein
MACEIAESVVTEFRGYSSVNSGETSAIGLTGYQAILEKLNLYDKNVRGAGTLTAVASLALGWLEPRPHEAVIMAANAIGTDTDTIASMAGAILGVTVPYAPEGPLLDEELINGVADRLVDVAEGVHQPSYQYPDLLTWTPPRTQADALQRGEHGLEVQGLGSVDKEVTAPIPASTGGDVAWQWLRLTSGQTVLIKRRRVLPPSRSPASQTSSHDDRRAPETEMTAVHETPVRRYARPASDNGRPTALELDVILEWVSKRQYRDEAIGYAVRRVLQEGSRDQLIALASALFERYRSIDQAGLFD